MGSRIRTNPSHVFEVFTEVARPGQPSDKSFVLQKYPDEFVDQKALESEVPKFAFPGETESSAVEHFSFALTDEEGKLRFGFCRHAAGSQTCLCIVSFLPWFEIFYRLLNLLAEILNRNESNSAVPLLDVLYKLPVPKPGERVDISSDGMPETFTFECPNPSELPSIPQNRNLTEYYNAMELSTMMSVFASMLQERRILITSRKLSRLTACVHGSASLLYPMHWQHIYIPVLPPHLIDYCSAPMPYLIGIHSSLFEKLRASEVGDAVVVNADNNTITSDYSDLESIPSEVVSALKKKLKAHTAEKMTGSTLGDGVTRAFMCANVALIGGYRQALRFPPGERITFDEDAFIHSRPPYMQSFLQKMLNTQMFEQFINERLDRLIAGEGFSDEFDNEVNLEQDKWATQSRYKEWYSNARKHGKKFRKDGREKWVEFSSKANPAMRDAMRAVRDKSKRAVKDLRARIDDLKKDDVNKHEKSGVSRNRPLTIDTPALKTQRPPRPPPMDHSHVLGTPIRSPSAKPAVNRTASYEKARQYKVITAEDLEDRGPAPRTRPRSPPPHPGAGPGYRSAHSLLRHSRHSRRLPSEDTDVLSDMTFQRVSLDLLGDQDIQTMLKKSYSLEDLVACGEARSSDDDDDDAGDDSEEWDDSEEIDYRELSPTAENEAPSKSGETEIGLDAWIFLDDNAPRNSAPRDVNANLPVQQQPAQVNKIPSNTSHESIHEQNAQLGNQGDQVDSSAGTPVVPKRKPRSIDARKSALGKPTYSLDGDLKATSSGSNNSGSPRLGFEDDFRPDVHAPPVPPKVPLKHSSSFSGQHGAVPESTTLQDSNKESTAVNTRAVSHPVPMRRTSINRKPAFYNEQRPQSFRKSMSGAQLATDAQKIKDARTAFMKSEGKKPVIQKREDLEQFDPLVTGQLAMDNPHETSSKSKDKEEDLLKEWDLDFTGRKSQSQAHTGPPVPPKPNSPSSSVSFLYGSSPVLNCYPPRPPFGQSSMAPVHRGPLPFSPGQAARWQHVTAPRVNQWSAMTQPRPVITPGNSQLQTQHQSVQNLIKQFSPASQHPSSPTMGGRPASQVVMRDKSVDLTMLSERPTSMYVEGPQDPFSVGSAHQNGGAAQVANGGTAMVRKNAALQSQLSVGNVPRTWEKFD